MTFSKTKLHFKGQILNACKADLICDEFYIIFSIFTSLGRNPLYLLKLNNR